MLFGVYSTNPSFFRGCWGMQPLNGSALLGSHAYRGQWRCVVAEWEFVIAWMILTSFQKKVKEKKTTSGSWMLLLLVFLPGQWGSLFAVQTTTRTHFSPSLSHRVQIGLYHLTFLSEIVVWTSDNTNREFSQLLWFFRFTRAWPITSIKFL